MNKNILPVIIIGIILLSAIGAALFFFTDLFKSCPSSCDDFNDCTEDYCSKETDFKCVNKSIDNCCGNKICEVEETYEACPKDCPKTIAIFVDTNTYSILKLEIDQYASDIKNDLNTDVKLFTDNFNTPQQIRSKLIELKNKNLDGSVLIGNIPISYFESGDRPFISCGGDFYTLPSDRYYMDLENDFIDENNNGMFEIDKYQGRYHDKMPDKLYWSGRIKTYNNDTDLLKAYFNRNHLYRTNQIQPQKSLLFYSSDIKFEHMGETYEETVKRKFSQVGLYSGNQVSVFLNISKSEFLTELSKDYESASINAHGHWTTQQIGEGINYEDIAEIKPQPYFYYLLSCANGDFSKEDYLAGHYLFDGNGLIVLAYTTPALLGGDESKFYVEYLAQGDTFGEAFIKVQSRVNELNTVIIGDPTLNLVEKTLKSNGDSCSLDSECQSGNCQNGICCISGETCCKYDSNCLSGYECSDYFCVETAEVEGVVEIE